MNYVLYFKTYFLFLILHMCPNIMKSKSFWTKNTRLALYMDFKRSQAKQGINFRHLWQMITFVYFLAVFNLLSNNIAINIYFLIHIFYLLIDLGKENMCHCLISFSWPSIKSGISWKWTLYQNWRNKNLRVNSKLNSNMLISASAMNQNLISSDSLKKILPCIISLCKFYSGPLFLQLFYDPFSISLCCILRLVCVCVCVCVWKMR